MTGVHGIQAGQNAKQLRHGRYSGRRTRRSERVYRVMFQAVHSPFTGLKCFIHVLATGLVLVLVECFFWGPGPNKWPVELSTKSNIHCLLDCTKNEGAKCHSNQDCIPDTDTMRPIESGVV